MQQLEYEFSNAIGYVIDRTIDPPKLIGQAFMASRSRLVTNASGVFHYLEAPWALEVHFPFPDIRVSVKAVNLHNDFDKVAARGMYLAQNGTPVESRYHTYMNDIAFLIIDPQPPDVPQDRIAELNRALSLPFSGEGVEASGNLRGSEFVQVINTALESGREGLLTLFDARNIPIAHIQIARGGILRVFHKQVMSSEMAFCELAYRQPAAGFAFKPGVDIPWGDVPEVQTPPDRLTWEAMRRANEIPKLLQQLGGKDARYQQVVQSFDPEAASEEIRWMVEPLWLSLDGYISLDQLPQRVGVDTYTILIAIRELVNRGVASQINRISPFPCSGTMGAPLVSHTDFEVHPWDPLQAFYLDPLSGKPTWLEGNFFGVANSLQPKNMLHTIAVPNDACGALILKDYKLIGLHIGAQELKPGQPAPPVKCFQFMWMGALLDLSTRKVRSPGESDEEGVGTLRSSLDALNEDGTPQQAAGERIQCPTCFAINSEYGACPTCGTVIEAPKEEEETNKILASKPVKELKKLQKKHNISNKQAVVIGSVICVPLMMLAMCSMPKKAADTKPVAPVPVQRVKAKPSDKKAVQMAVDEAGFSATAPPLYWYADTTAQTAPTPSFGLFSEQSNQKILFIIYDDMAPVLSLKNFAGKPPFVEVDRSTTDQAISDSGEQILGAGKLKWMEGHYTAPGSKSMVTVLLASFPAVKEGKSILVVATAYDTKSTAKPYSHKTTLFVLDEIASDMTAKANQELEAQTPGIQSDDEEKKAETESEDEGFDDEEGGDGGSDETSSSSGKVTSKEDIDKFLESAQKELQEGLELPEGAVESAKKYEEENKKPKKWKECGLLVGVDAEGFIKRMEILPVEKQSEKSELLNKAIEAAIQRVQKFKNPPVTKKPEFQFQVRLQGTELILIRKQ